MGDPVSRRLNVRVKGVFFSDYGYFILLIVTKQHHVRFVSENKIRMISPEPRKGAGGSEQGMREVTSPT